MNSEKVLSNQDILGKNISARYFGVAVHYGDPRTHYAVYRGVSSDTSQKPLQILRGIDKPTLFFFIYRFAVLEAHLPGFYSTQILLWDAWSEK